MSGPWWTRALRSAVCTLGLGDSTHDLESSFTEEQRDDVDKLNLYTHRVAIWIGDPRLPPKLIHALMRHELRHAEQFAANETVYRIGIMTLASLGRSTRHGCRRHLDPPLCAAGGGRRRHRDTARGPAGDAGEARRGERRSLITAMDPVRPLGELPPHPWRSPSCTLRRSSRGSAPAASTFGGRSRSSTRRGRRSFRRSVTTPSRCDCAPRPSLPFRQPTGHGGR
jgi:hypothetical protein